MNYLPDELLSVKFIFENNPDANPPHMVRLIGDGQRNFDLDLEGQTNDVLCHGRTPEEAFLCAVAVIRRRKRAQFHLQAF